MVYRMWNKKVLTWVAAVVLLLYCSGYVVCRTTKLIVHKTMDSGGKYTNHSVIHGDAKLASPNTGIAAFYTPLRYVELGYWHLVKPIGSPYP